MSGLYRLALMRLARLFLLLLTVLLVHSAMAQDYAPLTDDGDVRTLLLALDRQEKYVQKNLSRSFRLGNQRVPATRVLATIRELRKLTLTAHGTPRFAAELSQRFQIVAASNQATVTAYHTPLLAVRDRPDAQYRVPILGRPSDLVERGGRVFRRVNGELVTPPTRAQIMDGAYDTSRLALAWTNDPVELYYAQIQGHAVMVYADGRRKTLMFGGTNGYRFISGEAEVLNRIPPSQRPGGYLGLRDYLRAHPDEADRFFRANPRYIFFKPSNDPPYGMAGLPLTAGRSIATDKDYYSAGLVAYVSYAEPTRNGARQVHRVMFDADTGSAINGPARVDVYYGEGEPQDLFVGGLKVKGTLAFLLVRE